MKNHLHTLTHTQNHNTHLTKQFKKAILRVNLKMSHGIKSFSFVSKMTSTGHRESHTSYRLPLPSKVTYSLPSPPQSFDYLPGQLSQDWLQNTHFPVFEKGPDEGQRPWTRNSQLLKEIVWPDPITGKTTSEREVNEKSGLKNNIFQSTWPCSYPLAQKPQATRNSLQVNE